MMCEAQVWKHGEHWRCGLLKGHALTHAWILVMEEVCDHVMTDEYGLSGEEWDGDEDADE